MTELEKDLKEVFTLAVAQNAPNVRDYLTDPGPAAKLILSAACAIAAQPCNDPKVEAGNNLSVAILIGAYVRQRAEDFVATGGL